MQGVWKDSCCQAFGCRTFCRIFSTLSTTTPLQTPSKPPPAADVQRQPAITHVPGPWSVHMPTKYKNSIVHNTSIRSLVMTWMKAATFVTKSIQVSMAMRQCLMGHATWRTIRLVTIKHNLPGFRLTKCEGSKHPSASNILWRSPRQLPSICRSMRRIFLPKQTEVYLFCFHKRSC